ncbi:hypothetical protein [Stieleria varia]|uniref:Uncharacterized protein n=1 Tax=Stieleria varia TaxID=2528005 RepID=A0A5C6B858_9BACT|nr:hypothetical protein [Stieleria varia]TWU08455.1 hypothetical protein Pla52n_10380 [Stieleria varia]
MNRIITTIALAAVCLLTAEANAQVTASSYSTGGTAISTARGYGNTQLNATAVATQGGYARANMYGQGTNGGFARGNSTAISHGGVAISNGRSIANGWGAQSVANSTARTYQGFARSNSNAVANGYWAQAGADANTSTFQQYGSSSAEAIDNRMNNYNPVYPTYSTGVQPMRRFFQR